MPQARSIGDTGSGRPFDPSELDLVRRVEARLTPWLERSHLPRFPLSPLALVVIGLLGLGFLGAVFEPVLRGPRPLAVAGTTFACAIGVPILGLILSGLWDLARGPLEHFAPRLYDRLMRDFG